MDTLMDKLQEAGSSISGTLHKAILYVPKTSLTIIKKDDGVITPDSLKGENFSERTAQLAADKLQDSLAEHVNSHSTFQELKSVAESNFCAVKVQYNPSSISFSSNAESLQEGGIGEVGENSFLQVMAPPDLTMSATLVLDAVNVQDAFFHEKYRVSINDFAEKVHVKNNAATYRVDQYVNALLALCVRGATRHVVFHWSEMSFAGELSGMKASYTMFSPSGRPIRAKVDMDIKRTLKCWENIEEVHKGYWKKAYETMFGKA